MSKLDTQKLDAADYIGMNLNSLTRVDTLDVGKLLREIPSGARGLKLSDTNHVQQVSYTVDKANRTKDFDCSQDLLVSKNIGVEHKLEVFNSGSEATKFLQIDASASASYGGFSASGSTTFTTSSSLSESSMYAFYSWNEDFYDVKLNGHPETHLDPSFVATVLALPQWDQDNTDTVQQYKDFFDENGTHCIIGATSGWRYLLRIEYNKVNEEVDSSFAAHVKAEYSGVGNMSGSVETKTKDTYKQYLDHSHASCSVRGGSPSANATAQSSADRTGSSPPGPDFQQWVSSTSDGTGEEILNVRLIQLDDLLRRNAKTKEISTSITDALKYLTGRAGHVTYHGRLLGWTDRISFQLLDPPPTTEMVVKKTPPGIQTNPIKACHYWMGPNKSEIGMIVEGGWQNTTFFSVDFELRLAHVNDSFTFRLQHGAASNDDGNFSRLEFFPLGDTELLYAVENRQHGQGTHNEQIFRDQRIPVPKLKVGP